MEESQKMSSLSNAEELPLMRFARESADTADASGEDTSKRNTSSSSESTGMTAQTADTETKEETRTDADREYTRTYVSEVAPASPETEELSRRRKSMEAKTNEQLLREALALSMEDCNRLISEGTEAVKALSESNRETLSALEEALCGRLTDFLKNSREQNDFLLSKTRERNDSVTKELSGFADGLGRQVTDCVSKLEKAVRDSAEEMQKKTEEISLVYQSVLERSLGEVRSTETRLEELLKEEPLKREKTADLIKGSIESTAKELTKYCEKELAGSVASLKSTLKKTKTEFDELGKEARGSGRFARVMRVAGPAILALTCFMSFMGLFL